MFSTGRTARRGRAGLTGLAGPRRSAGRPTRAAFALVLAATVMATASSSAVAASPTKGATYAHGTPGDDTEVALAVSRGGRSLSDVDIILHMTCSNGRETLGVLLWFAGLTRPARVPIKRDGSFSQRFVDDENLNPFAVSQEYWLSGRFIRRGRAARVVVRTRHVGEGGTVCDTGDRQVTARRQVKTD